jgi:hypothetical protein
MRRLLIALSLVAALAGCGSAVPTPRPAASPDATADGSPVAGATPTTAPTAEPTALPSASPAVVPTPEPTGVLPLPCRADQLTGAVTGWEGAAGHQIASVVLGTKGQATCFLQGTPQLQLVDAIGLIVIDSAEVGAAGLPHVDAGDPSLPLGPGESARTQVSTANYCDNVAPTLPTTIAMVLPSDGGRIVLDPGPGGDVPACMASPGDAGSIDMNGWTR